MHSGIIVECPVPRENPVEKREGISGYNYAVLDGGMRLENFPHATINCPSWKLYEQ